MTDSVPARRESASGQHRTDPGQAVGQILARQAEGDPQVAFDAEVDTGHHQDALLPADPSGQFL